MMPHARVQITHPTWCRAPHDDEVDDTDPRHLGPAETMLATADDYSLSVRLDRADDIHAGAQRHGQAGVLLEAESLAVLARAGELRSTGVFLTAPDARRLAVMLGAFADAADADTAEVAW
jgi:hypothetical protein